MSEAGSELTVVMYHYVRPIRGSKYPGIKGLEVEGFRNQLAHIARDNTVVTMEAVVAAFRGEEKLPPRAALLTFDDGYRDHHDFAVPVLAERGMQGSFFVPARPVLERRVLDVNKLHFILASAPDSSEVAREMEILIEAEPSAGGALPEISTLRERHHSATRFDSADTAYVKRLLQRVLPEAFRGKTVAKLFARFVSADETSLADELYLDISDLERMKSAGMHIGGHGDRHYWLGSIPAAAQAADIEASLAFVRSIAGGHGPLTFCYPYGDYNADTLNILERMSVAAAFTTRVDRARVPGTPPLEIPRLDTNDLPQTQLPH